MARFTVYKFPFPSRAERVLWTLEELGFDYETKVVNPMDRENFKEDYLALNPYAKVPTLLYEGRVYTESLAIMAYLNELHPEQPLVSRDIEERFLANQAMSYAATEIEPYAWIIMQATLLKQYYQWPEGTVESAKVRLGKAMPIVWSWLESREYLSGADFGLVDIYYYGLIYWVRSLDIPVPENIVPYLKKIQARPKFPHHSNANSHD